jgi:hypothetical protein
MMTGTLHLRALGSLNNLAPFWLPLASYLVTRVSGLASFAVLARVLLLVCISIVSVIYKKITNRNQIIKSIGL